MNMRWTVDLVPLTTTTILNKIDETLNRPLS